MKYTIYDKTGQIERCAVHRLEYNGEFMGPCSVMCTIKSSEPINFEIGDYLVYRGERFEINYDPSIVKKCSKGLSGEAFVYDSVKFNSLSDELTRCDFLDYVLNDNQIHFTALPRFSFYASSIRDLADRIQANLDRVYKGSSKWNVSVNPEFAGKTNINVDISNMNVWEALALAYNMFDAHYVIKGRNITIGASGVTADHLFQYGKGNGLKEIERQAEQDQLIVTRLRVYGSTRNLPNRYYNKLTKPDGSTILPDNMAVQNLMLPGFPKDTLDSFIDSKNITRLGIREHTIYFDGGEEGLDEIYPSLEGMTAEQLRDAGVNIELDAGDNGKLDEVVSAEQLSDNGILPEEGELKPIFTLTIKDVGFDINKYLATETAVISMKDGMCGGREFEIVKCEKKGNKYELTCNRTEDTSIGRVFPYKDYNIKKGDRFVLLHISMPEAYINAASQRLKEAADEWLKKHDFVRYSYSPKVDDIFMARQHDEAVSKGTKSLHDTLKEGDLMLFSDTDLGIDGAVIIDTLNIKEGEGLIPKYSVVLKNEKTVGTIEKIQQAIESIASGGTGGGGYNLEQIISILKNYGTRFFLRKDQPDQTDHLLKLLGGVLVDGGVALLHQGAQFGESFAGGLTGHGGRIDGAGHGELRSLRLWEFLEVPELRYNQVKVFVGIDWQCPGAGIIESVTPDKGPDGALLSTGTAVLKLEEGQYGAIDVDDIAMGIYHFGNSSDATTDKDDSKGNFAFAGFATAYWRITSVDAAHKTFRYALRPGHSVHPQPQMTFACYGNFTKPERQTSTYRTRTYTRRLWKQNNWEIAKDNIAAQDGDLSNLSVHGLQLKGYSTYLDSIYFTGTIQHLKKPDGTTVQLVNERGKWVKDTRYDYYDRVSHNGSLWLCVNEKGTNAEPLPGNADWLQQVDKGSDGADIFTYGDWREGLLVKKNGIVTMGGKAFMAKVDTENPPMWVYTDDAGVRYITEDGYVLTSEYNTEEYMMLVESGTDGPQGVPGKDGVDGTDGKTLYTWIRYADDEHGNGISNDPTGKAYIGFAYNKEVAQESNNPEDYHWSRIKGEQGLPGLDGLQGPQGLQGIPGKDGADGKTTYFHVKYSPNANGIPMLETPAAYIGTYVDFTEADSDDPKKYGWAKFEGTDGKDGENGIPGKNGIDGKTSYLHIAYATSADGSQGFSVGNPEGKSYIGQYVDFVEADSTDYRKYKWSLIKGTDGIPGKPGADGKTYYTWVAYSDNANGNPMYQVPYDGTKYIGIAVNKDTREESSNPADYTWSLFKGADGESITNFGPWKSGVTVPIMAVVAMGGNSFLSKKATTNPPMWIFTDAEGNRYITEDGYVLTGECNEAEYTLLVQKGEDGMPGKDGQDGLNGADGVNGTDGTGIVWKGTLEEHPLNPENGWAYRNSADKKTYIYQDGQWYQMTIDGVDGQNGAPGKDGIGIVWKGDMVSAPANPQKNWVYRDTDNGRVYIYNGTAWKLMVVDGSDGQEGAPGQDGLSVYITYHDSVTAPLTPTGNGTTEGWHHNATESVRWMSQKVAASVDAGTWGGPIEIKGQKGDKGEQGQPGLDGLQGPQGEQGIPGTPGKDGADGRPGADGRTTYFHVKYSPNANGVPMSETPDVYIGTYVDFTEADSTSPTAYKWMRFQGLQGKDGTDGIPGVNGADGKTSYLHIKYSNDGGNTFTANAGETPGDYIGVLTDFVKADSTRPSDYKWSKTKGQPGADGQDGRPGADGKPGATGPQGPQGDGFTHMGRWKSGMLVPKMGVVTMGGSSYVAKVATRNAPVSVYKDARGNAFIYADGGYVLTGEINTAEYDVLSEKGEDGAAGLQGCIIRDSEWSNAGVQYRNDEALTGGTRFIDIALVESSSNEVGYACYKCKVTHNSNTSNKPGTSGGETYWELMSNVGPIFTSLLIAKNAKIKFLQGNQLLIQKSNGTVAAGISGSDAGDKTRFWAGSNTPDSAPFAVNEEGVATAERFRTGRTGCRMEAHNGVIDIFGDFARNIQFGVNEQGMAILKYFDNSGNLLYDLGPGGISKIPIREESWHEDRWTFLDADLNNIFNAKWATACSPVSGSAVYRYSSKMVAGVLDDAANDGKYFSAKNKAQQYLIKDGWYALTLKRMGGVNGDYVRMIYNPSMIGSSVPLPSDMHPNNPNISTYETIYINSLYLVSGGEIVKRQNIYYNLRGTIL